eukprot:CAMPEP_0198285828 /NCGR_PEP_ID=MMETSP1449-20131203/5082_1 /TAXON_ID=420275 /ORGANISM="Attheya septentrionalis, Strain CCMP2084" /LENGTH=34 /DNA_ID= /DNA_START= /DNA_END= /DNA_ORIENTATION=
MASSPDPNGNSRLGPWIFNPVCTNVDSRNGDEFR